MQRKGIPRGLNKKILVSLGTVVDRQKNYNMEMVTVLVISMDDISCRSCPSYVIFVL